MSADAVLNGLVYVTSLALIASKFGDCYTTATAIARAGGSTRDEHNGIARAAMNKYGTNHTIWGVFALVVVVVVYATYAVCAGAGHDRTIASGGYIAVGGFVATVQFAVAYSNYCFMQRGRNQSTRQPPAWVKSISACLHRVMSLPLR